jgi:hypothetical protein
MTFVQSLSKSPYGAAITRCREGISARDCCFVKTAGVLSRTMHFAEKLAPLEGVKSKAKEARKTRWAIGREQVYISRIVRERGGFGVGAAGAAASLP